MNITMLFMGKPMLFMGKPMLFIGKPMLFMGKPIISMAMFNSYVTNYQRLSARSPYSDESGKAQTQLAHIVVVS